MAQNPGDDLVNTLKNTFIKPAQTALDTVNKFVPDALVPKSLSPTQSTSTGWKPEPNEEQKQQIAKERAPVTPKPKPKLPSHKEGTDRVNKTGPAILHKDEAVLNKDDADKFRAAKGKPMNTSSAVKSVADELGGKKEPTPKKEIKHVIVRKAKTKEGKHINIHTHVHTHAAHPDEEHITEGNDGLVNHMLENQGEPNPGEAEADAGQSGIPGAAGAAPQPGASAGSPPPVAA